MLGLRHRLVFILCFVLGSVFAALGYAGSYAILDFFSGDKDVVAAGAAFMKYQFLGLPFFLLIVSYRGFFFGIGHTKIFMISAILINVFNIVLNYLFIFGALGFPKLSLAGAGIGVGADRGRLRPADETPVSRRIPRG